MIEKLITIKLILEMLREASRETSIQNGSFFEPAVVSVDDFGDHSYQIYVRCLWFPSEPDNLVQSLPVNDLALSSLPLCDLASI